MALLQNPRHHGSPSSLTIVIKLGTSSIIDAQTHKPLLSLLSTIAEVVCRLKSMGHRVVIVSSGAIGVGMKRMGMRERGKGLQAKQALAAIGQGRLIALWDNLFSQLEQPIAQILLTRGDISDRTRYLNAVNTFSELLTMGVVPIVNENDTISVSEIKFGDNDTLSAITSNMVHADYLFLMTDVDCLYTDNPRKNPDAKPVRVVSDIAEVRKSVSTSTLGTSLGTGGMETKLIAAELATGAGVTTVILNSLKTESIFSIIGIKEGETDEATLPQHTRFLRGEKPIGDRKWWILHGLHSAGTVIVDEGAYRALLRKESGGRLLAAGVVSVTGSFASQQAVNISVRRKKAILSASDSSTDSPTFLSITTPSTPFILPTLSLSNSIASLDPLSNPVSPALVATHSAMAVTRGASRLSEEITVGVNGMLQDMHVDSTAQEAEESLEDEWEFIDVGKGQANFNSSEIDRVKGLKSSQISAILGYADSEYVVDCITIRHMLS